MKYQVILNNSQVLSTHKSRELAERGLKRAMKKQQLEDDAHNRMVSWVDSKLVRRTSGIYHIRATQ
jgi:hypothetical protein